MINLFQLLKKHEKSLTEGFENKKYWETREDNHFERNVIGPDGNYSFVLSSYLNVTSFGSAKTHFVPSQTHQKGCMEPDLQAAGRPSVSFLVL